MLRVVAYWLFCLLSITLLVMCWNIYTGPPRRFVTLLYEIYTRHAPALAASLILLPIVMLDVARLSARFVGPVLRLRGAMKELAEGQQTRPLAFRDNDFWQELAQDFNRAAARVPQSMLGRPTEAMPPTRESVEQEAEEELARS